MSTTQEYYIRSATETDARGPFTLEQLQSLAENGQVDLSCYFYDAAAEAWVCIADHPPLLSALFPEKKTLRVKAKTDAQVKTLNTMSAADRPITVNDMLLAAEGRTEDTRDKADPAIAQARAATIGLYSCLAILVVTAAAYILPSIDVIMSGNFGAMLHSPLIFLGALNLALGICVGLGSVGVYPTVRFAAMLGLGFTGCLFYFEGLQLPVLFAAATAVGLYFGTIVLNIPGVIASALLGFVGACGLAHHLFTT